METKRSATSCRWAIPTLFQAEPIWLDAWARPWTCMRDSAPRTLLTTEECRSCPGWEPQALYHQTPVAGVPLASDWPVEPLLDDR